MQESNYNIVIIFLIALCLISCGSTNIGLNTKEDFQSESRKNFYPVTGMWESMAGPPGGGYFNSLVQNPYNHKELYAHSQEIVFHTMDGGESWTILKDLKNIHINKIVPYRDRLFICGDGLHEYTKEGGLVNILKLECANIFISDDKLLVLPYLYPDGRDEILLLSLLIEGYNMQKILIPKNFLSYFNISNQSSHKDTWIECNDVIISGENILMALTAKFGESEEQDQSRIFLTENLGENWKLMDVPLVHRSGVSRLIKDKDDESCIYLLIAHNLIHDLISPLSEMVYRSFDMGKSWESFIEIDIDANGPLNLIKRDKAYYILDPKGAGIIKFTGDECEIVDCPRIDYWNEISFQIDTLYFDNTNPDVVYAKTDSRWYEHLEKNGHRYNSYITYHNCTASG